MSMSWQVSTRRLGMVDIYGYVIGDAPSADSYEPTWVWRTCPFIALKLLLICRNALFRFSFGVSYFDDAFKYGHRWASGCLDAF